MYRPNRQVPPSCQQWCGFEHKSLFHLQQLVQQFATRYRSRLSAATRCPVVGPSATMPATRRLPRRRPAAIAGRSKPSSTNQAANGMRPFRPTGQKSPARDNRIGKGRAKRSGVGKKLLPDFCRLPTTVLRDKSAGPPVRSGNRAGKSKDRRTLSSR